MQWVKKYRECFLLLAVACIGYWQVAFMQNTLKWDVIDQYYPWRMFVVQCLREGIWPLWNPYEQFGFPMHGDPQSGVWYPFVWLSALFQQYTVYTVQAEYMLHVFLGGVGMMLLLKNFEVAKTQRFLFSCAYMLCGLYVGNAQHLTFVIAACWLPFVFNTFKNMLQQPTIAGAIWFALFCYLLLSGGYPAFTITVFYILLACTFYHILVLYRTKHWRELKTFCTVLMLSILLTLFVSAGLLLSIYQSNGYLARANGLSYSIASQGPFSPQSIISLLFPLASAKDPQFFDTDISMSSIYTGLVTLLGVALFLTQKKSKGDYLLAATTFFFLLASFGKYTPVREMLFDFVPFMNLFRFPSIFRLFVIIGLLLIAGRALTKTLIYKKIKLSLFVMAMLCIVAVLYSLYEENEIQFPTDYSSWFAYCNSLSFDNALFTQGCIQLFFLIGLILISRSRYRPEKKWKLLAVIAIADMVIAAQLSIPINVINENKTSVVYEGVQEKGVRTFPVPELRPMRMNNDSTGFLSPFWRNLQLFTKQPAWDGYNSFQLSNYIRFFDEQKLRTAQLQNNWLHYSDTIVYYTDSIYPIKAEVASVMYAKMQDKGSFSEVSGRENTVLVTEYEPGHMKLHATVKTPSANLVWMQQYYPGWKVYVDNKELKKIYSTSYLFMTVVLPTGNHEVEYRYENSTIKLMAYITVFFFLALPATLLFLCLRKHRVNSLPR